MLNPSRSQRREFCDIGASIGAKLRFSRPTDRNQWLTPLGTTAGGESG